MLQIWGLNHMAPNAHDAYLDVHFQVLRLLLGLLYPLRDGQLRHGSERRGRA